MKNVSRPRVPLLAAVLLGVLTMVPLALNARAGGARAAKAPTVVGVVDLEKLMGALNEAKARQDGLSERVRLRQAEIDALDKKIEELQQTIKDTPDIKVAEKQALILEFYENTALRKAKYEVLSQFFKQESGQQIGEVYKKIVAAAETVAQREGIDLILLDDRGFKVPERGNEDDMNRTIQQKRIIYAKPELDITADIAIFMNNQYAAPGKTS